MSLMNVMSVTLVVLILGAVAALFLGTRSSDAAEVSRPVFVPVPQAVTALQARTAVPNAMADLSYAYAVASVQ